MAASLGIPAGRSTAAGLPLPHRRRIPATPTYLAVRSSAGEGSPALQPDLSVKVNGLEMPNPFVIGSGPPGTNYTVMKRAFDEGWGAVIAKTVNPFAIIVAFLFSSLLFLGPIDVRYCGFQF